MEDGYQEYRDVFREPEPREWQGQRLSGWWRRVFATLLDCLVLFPIQAGLGLLAGLSLEEQLNADLGGFDGWLPAEEGWLVIAVIITASLLYLPAIMVMTNGRTVGKIVLRIRVVRTDHLSMTFGRATLREVLVKTLAFGFTPFAAPALGVIDCLWPLWDRENRAIHDMLARTRVVLRESSQLTEKST